MKTQRFLVPFTQGMSLPALEQAVLLAQSRHATLVPAALIRVKKGTQSKGPRLEYIQQSQDFLEAVRCRAVKHSVPVENVEVLTTDVVQCIDTLAGEKECDGVLLFVHGEDGLLLDTVDVKRILEHTARKLYIFHLGSKGSVRLQVC